MIIFCDKELVQLKTDYRTSSICKKLLFFYLFAPTFFFLTILMSLTGRYQWRCEKPLFYSADKKSKVLKRRRE